MKTIKTILSCNSALFCEGMASLLQNEADIEIVGKIDNSVQAMKSLRLRPDVFILDPLLFKPEELSQVVQELKIRSPRTGILLLFSEKEMTDEALMHYMKRGVDGYIKRKAKLTHLVEAIRTVHAGSIWADRRLLVKCLRYSPDLASSLEAKLSNLENPLTKREKEIVNDLLLGLRNKDISRKLHISEKTVKTHLNNIFKKMKVTNRTQVVSDLIHPH